MDETKFIWMDGLLVPWKDAKIHVLTHSLHYGSAVFEGIRCYDTTKGPAIFRLQDHTKRLFNSAKTMRMTIPFSEQQINNAIINVVKENKLQSGYIRPLAYYGYGKMGLSVKGAPVNVSIACWPWGAYLGENPVKVKIPKIIRIHPKSTVVEAKISGTYANSILAGEEAHESGFDEALLVDYKGNISEGPGENIFMVKKGKLYTPPLGTILSGITRSSVITLAKDQGFQVLEKSFKPSEILKANEAFFTGTAAEITPIGMINNSKINNGKIGPITEQLRLLYREIIHGKNKKYEPWLTVVK